MMENIFKRMFIYVWLSHFAEKLAQHCKSTIILKKISRTNYPGCRLSKDQLCEVHILKRAKTLKTIKRAKQHKRFMSKSLNVKIEAEWKLVFLFNFFYCYFLNTVFFYCIAWLLSYTYMYIFFFLPLSYSIISD